MFVHIILLLTLYEHSNLFERHSLPNHRCDVTIMQVGERRHSNS